MGKRCFDLAFALPGLVLLTPLFLVVAVLIKADSAGPVFFRQERVGRGGRPFLIHKFRTMRVHSQAQGLQLTVGADRRITRVGAVLRRYKLDELPQLIDVLLGSMSLVGPRPEVAQYVALYPPAVRDVVLSVRPGITDRAAIEFADESSLLAGAADPHALYVERILPQKLSRYVQYVRSQSLREDVRILLATLRAIFSRHG
jgi:lipopolysaccharide/colanic/teichoic acid biosynthesis glycosyltransferase